MKKKITILSVLLFALSLCLVKPIVTTEHNEYNESNVNNEKDVLAENLEMYFMQNGSRISSITIAPGGSATVDFYINVEGAQARFAQTAIAGINLRNGINTTTVKVASDMPEGLYYLVGSYNGYSVMIDINVVKPHECSYVSKTISNATCTSEGVISNICECGSSYETKIPKLNHTYNSVVVKPTCSKEGYTKNTCTMCSYSYNSDTTSKLAHTLSTLPAKEATCTTTGLTVGSKCTVCNTVVTEQQIVPKLTHNYTDWTTTITPSCTKEGKKQRTCKKCNNIEVVNLEKTDHAWNNTYTVDKNATCTTTGSKSIHCKNCAATKNIQTVAKKEHKVVTVPAREATCTSTGLTEGSKCSVCNKVIVAQKTTEMAPHNYNSWNTISTATCEKEGKEQRRCQRCNNIEFKVLNKTDHNWNSTYTVDKAATCTKEGSKSIHCKNCSSTKNVTTIPKNQHNVVNANEKDVHTKCSICNETISTEHSFKLSSTKKETCLSAGKYTYTCDCGYSYVETKPLLKHVDTDGNNSCDNCSLLLLTEEISSDNNKCTTCNGTGKAFIPLKLRLHNRSIFRVRYNKYNYILGRLEKLNLSPLYVNKKLNTNYMGTTILPVLNDKCRDCLGTGINKLIKDPSFT